MILTNRIRARSLAEEVVQAAYLHRTWKLIWTAAPHQTVAWALLLLAQGLVPLAPIYLSKLLVDSLVIAARSNGAWENVRPTLVLVSLMACALLLVELLQSASSWLRAAQSELIQDHIKELVHRQAATIDLALYESSEFYDRLERASRDAISRPLALLESFGGLAQNGVALIAMAAMLVPYGLWVPLVLVVSTLPALYVALRFERRYHRWWQQTTPDRRRAQYYDMLLTNSFPASELRILGINEHIRQLYQSLRQRLRSESLQQTREQSVGRLVASLGALFASGCIMALMVWRALQGAITLGDLTLFYQAFQRGQGLMRTILANLGQIHGNTLFLQNLFEFLDLRPTMTRPSNPAPVPTPLREGIRFEDVSFHYPGTTRPALQDFSMIIPADKVVAIVGANGAGKTTLVKLLCGFYQADAGSIRLDGTDIRSVDPEELRRHISVLFQFPVLFEMTAAENIALGDISYAHSDRDIQSAARSAGVHETIANLPNGYMTHLGRTFANGVQLSGGEWQRIAAARAYLRMAPILILDEPTSFLDSWAEAKWFERFRMLAKGRTGVIITHRFTIAMRADVIHVMDRGRVVESGSHAELVAKGGLYAQSWSEQMRASSANADNSIDQGSRNGHTSLEHLGSTAMRD